MQIDLHLNNANNVNTDDGFFKNLATYGKYIL